MSSALHKEGDTDKWILAQKHRTPKIQFAKHKKIKKREDQWVDTSFLLRIGNKIPMEGVTETKCGAETEREYWGRETSSLIPLLHKSHSVSCWWVDMRVGI